MRLADDRLQLHGDRHVTVHLQLATHERIHAVQAAFNHVNEIAERDLQGAVCWTIVVGDGIAVLAIDVDFAGVAEIKLHCVAESWLGFDTLFHASSNCREIHLFLPERIPEQAWEGAVTPY